SRVRPADDGRRGGGAVRRGYGEVSPDWVNSRNGYRRRERDTRAGTAELAIPKLRARSYFPSFLEDRRRAERREPRRAAAAGRISRAVPGPGCRAGRGRGRAGVHRVPAAWRHLGTDPPGQGGHAGLVRGWRDIKQVIDLRRACHRREDRIRAHVILCWLALLPAPDHRERLGQTWPELRRELDRIHVGAFAGPPAPSGSAPRSPNPRPPSSRPWTSAPRPA